MQRSSRPRATAELSRSLHQQLNTYALAAGAAGVGLLALAPPAEAKIIYTPAHRVISQSIATISISTTTGLLTSRSRTPSVLAPTSASSSFVSGPVTATAR
jgi:hypothetical protein